MNNLELVEILSGRTCHVYYGMGGYNGAPVHRQRGYREIVPGCGFTWTNGYACACPQSGEVTCDREELENFLASVPVGFEVQWNQYCGSNWEGCHTFKKLSSDSWSEEYDGGDDM